jgi:hypothetical protein
LYGVEDAEDATEVEKTMLVLVASLANKSFPCTSCSQAFFAFPGHSGTNREEIRKMQQSKPTRSFCRHHTSHDKEQLQYLRKSAEKQ